MNDSMKQKRHALRQRQYRERLGQEGYQRFDISIPPDVWAKIKPHLREYGYPHYPAKAIVKLLGDISFGDDQ